MKVMTFIWLVSLSLMNWIILDNFLAGITVLGAISGYLLMEGTKDRESKEKSK